jgi:MFS family permease
LTSSDDLLIELKSTFNNLIRNKESIEGKANNVIVASGTIAALLFSFGTLFLTKLNPEYGWYWYAIIFLLIGVIGNVIAVVFATLAGFRREILFFPVAHNKFYKNDGNYDNDEITKYEKKGHDEFTNELIKSYLHSIKENARKNLEKAHKLMIAHWLLVAGVLSTPILIGLAVHAISQGMLQVDIPN